MGEKSIDQSRILSLDQFRGYTVLGMFFVNFVPHFQAIPEVFKHHNTYSSYADTIMPQFFFAVGFAFRLTLLRRLESVGPWPAYLRVLRRNLGLILLGIVIYHLDGEIKNWATLQELGFWGFLQTAFQREPFQTLVHIGVTAIWIMPVVAARPSVRVGFAILSGLLHLALSYWFYHQWVWSRPGIDGGPLGFLTWAIPMLAGTLAYDLVVTKNSTSAAARLLAWGLALMVLGYAFSCLNLVKALDYASSSLNLTPPNPPPSGEATCWLAEPPFVPPAAEADGRLLRPVNLWSMSQRAGSLSYLTFGAGFSLALYAIFVLACDAGRFRLGILETLGSNALAAYIIHMLVMRAVKPYAPGDSPLWYALTSFSVFLGITYLFIRHLEKNKLFLRL